jgi:NADPH2:quinone reductase
LQQYRFKTIKVIRRREQETIIRSLAGNEVICTDDEDLWARPEQLTAGKGVERAIAPNACARRKAMCPF